MGPRRRSKGKVDREAEEEELEERETRSVVVLTSSDDEEANKDLSLEIVEKARNRRGKRLFPTEDDGVAKRVPLVELSSASDDGVGGELVVPEEEAEEKKKRKKRKKSKKSKEVVEEDGAAEMLVKGEESQETLGMADSVHTGANGASDLTVLPELVNAHRKDDDPLVTEDSLTNEPSDNVILRKLLRGPRYFDPGDSTWQGSCFNCGEEGHAAANCTAEKRRRPCFVCGMFGHNSYQCTKGQDCFICRRRGHFAKDCPDKHQRNSHDYKICLRCGDAGHDMLTCSNDYAPEDMKDIQCYVCRKFGHLCCVDCKQEGSGEVFCYICAQSGHTGAGCAKQSAADVDASPSLCYKCGEEGHFARGCTKSTKSDRSDKFMGKLHTPPRKFSLGESSTTSRRFASGESSKRSQKYVEDKKGFQSAPHYAGKTHNKQRVQHEGRWNGTPRVSRSNGGWTVDGPGETTKGRHKASGWVSSSTYGESYNKKQFTPSSGHYSSSRSSPRKHKYFSNSQNSASRHGLSDFRSGRSQGHYGRN